MSAPTPTIRDAHAVIRQIAEYAEAIASQAGVGSSETAGVIVSFLWHRPSLMHEFMAGTLSTVDLGMFDHHNGLLSWHGRDGKIYEPDPSKARVAAPAIEPLPDRNALESIPADGGTVKALDEAVLQAIRSWGDGPCDSLEDLERRVLSCLSTHTAAGAGPVGEAVADEGWQPIETAPTGGKFGCFLMLAFGPQGDQTVSEGMHFQGRFYAASVFYTGGPHDTKQFTFQEHEVKPTHWRHTLAAPGAARPVEGPGEVKRMSSPERKAADEAFRLVMIRAEDAEAALAERDRADRASQEERIREDERDRIYERAERHAAGKMPDVNAAAAWLTREEDVMLPTDRARQRGDAS